MLIMLRILDWILNWTVRFFGKCGDWFLEERRCANPDYWLLGKQHLMYFWLEDYVNKVSCCFESVLNAKGLCWHRQGPVKTGASLPLCAHVGDRSSVPWQSPSMSGACGKSGHWPRWDANKPRSGFTGELWNSVGSAQLCLAWAGGSQWR